MLLGFLNPFRIIKFLRLRSALEEYRRRASIEVTMKVARLLAEVGDRPAALAHLRRARQRFPQSSELRDLNRKLWADVAQEEIRTLELVVKEGGRPEDMARLIELHRSLQEFERALVVVGQAEEKFPESWVVKLAAGKLLYHRFLLEGEIADAERAAALLREAARIKPDCVRALFYLGALAVERGDKGQASTIVEELVRVSPEDRRADRLRALLRAPAGAARAAAPPSSPSLATPDIEEPGRESLLEDLRKNPQVCMAFVLEADGKVVEQVTSVGKVFSLEGKEASVSALCRALRAAAERMGIGRLQTCVLEGEPWWIYFADVAGRFLVVFADHGFKPDAFEAVVNRWATEPVAL